MCFLDNWLSVRILWPEELAPRKCRCRWDPLVFCSVLDLRREEKEKGIWGLFATVKTICGLKVLGRVTVLFLSPPGWKQPRWIQPSLALEPPQKNTAHTFTSTLDRPSPLFALTPNSTPPSRRILPSGRHFHKLYTVLLPGIKQNNFRKYCLKQNPSICLFSKYLLLTAYCVLLKKQLSDENDKADFIQDLCSRYRDSAMGFTAGREIGLDSKYSMGKGN